VRGSCCCFVRALDERRWSWLAGAMVAGTGAALIKSSTLAVWILPAASLRGVAVVGRRAGARRLAGPGPDHPLGRRHHRAGRSSRSAGGST